MTCCLVVALPGVSLAAADTRTGIEHSEGQLIHDGPDDLRIHVAFGKTVVVPYKYRKMRHLGDGWAVGAGEFVSLQKLLDRLKENGSSQFTQAKRLIQERSQILESVKAEVGIAEEQLLKTIILGAPLGIDVGVWSIGLRDNDPRTNPRIGEYAINWPFEVPLPIQQQKNQELTNNLLSAHATHNTLALVKAVARVVGVANEYSDKVGPLVQVGISVANPEGGYQALYIDDSIVNILALTNAEFLQRAESAG